MIVIDTHVLIWWLSEPRKLTRKASRALKGAKRVGVPAISIWELAMLASRGRIRLDRSPLDWLNTALDEPRVELVPLTPSIAVQSTRLTHFHGDPADRLIVATAIVEAAPLVTADARIAELASVEVLWD